MASSILLGDLMFGAVLGGLGLVVLNLMSQHIVKLIKAVVGEETYEKIPFQYLLIFILFMVMWGLLQMFPKTVSASHFNMIPITI